MPVVFFVVAVSLFPLGVGPEPQTLRQIAAGIVWVCALLASMLSVASLCRGPGDGSLEQMMCRGSREPRRGRQGRRALDGDRRAAGARRAVDRPVARMSGESLAALVASLLLGTPILSLLGGLGAALTLGLRSAGVLLILLIVPLSIPALIFGAGAVGAVDSGISASGHFSLLGALLIFTVLCAPVATSFALGIALE